MLMIDPSKFQHADVHFNLVAFDLQAINKDKSLYNVILKFYKSDEEKQEIVGGMYMRTNIIVSNTAEAFVAIQGILETGVLLHEISATGFIYDEDNVKIDSVNWNEIEYADVEAATLKAINTVPGNSTIH
jgi:hypothetical protein